MNFIVSAELADEKKDKRKENKFEKKFFLKKESKDKGYSSLAGAFNNQDAVFLVNTKYNYIQMKN